MAEKKKASKRTKPIPRKKIKALDELKDLIEKSNTIIVSSIKGIPSLQFQKIRKDLRGKAEIKVVKKRIANKAIEEAKKDIKELRNYIEDNSAILFSELDVFELAGILSKSKSKVKAKAGQEAPEDLVVAAGPTDIPAGPMISELSNAGIKIAVESGKIAIKQDSIIVKKGEKISEQVANILTKLEIFPFTIGLNALIAYDSKEKKIYIGIKIDKEEAENSIIKTASEAFNLAIELGYYCSDTIEFLLSKANSEAQALQNQLPNQKKEENKENKQTGG